jgi:glycosyltransferase involved in cell wall biosynthesis
MVSILILTKNEEVNIEACVQSVAWSNDIVVFDSFSDDRTVELAEKAGARVEQRRFDHYAAQRNAALALEFRNNWVLMVDADERVPPELCEEIETVLQTVPESVAMFRMRRKDFFCGRWLRHASAYPTWFGRLVRPGAVRVEREINEEYQTEGDVRCLRGHLIHYPFSKGLAGWFERHNRYSSEARALLAERGRKMPWRGLCSKESVERRKALKQLAYRLPCRPVWVFAYLYFFRMGWLDGRPGFRYCMMRSMYEYMIDLKMAEFSAP